MDTWYLLGVTRFVARINSDSEISSAPESSFKMERLTNIRIKGGDALQTSSNIRCELPKNVILFEEEKDEVVDVAAVE